MDVDVDHALKVVKVRLFGALSPETIRDAASQVFVSYGGYHRLWDLRNASIGDLTGDQLSSLAKFARDGESQPGEVRSALVVQHDLDYGVGRMYQMSGEDVLPAHFGVFRDEDEAMLWLTSDSA